jgi:acetyl-CoA carboxylase carboxyl transferase subunit beta
MNWLTDYVKPKLSSLVNRKEPPSDLWTKCGCGERTLYVSDLKENLNVCSYCDYHMNMDVNSRLKNLFGDNSFELIEVPFENNDPLKFKDLKKYSDRMKAAQKKTDQKDAAILAQGEIGDTKVVVFILDFNFMGGSMGQFVGEAFKIGCQNAVDLNCPFISVASSGGARMQEGIVSLMQLPKTVAAVNMLDQHKIPYISVLTHPTTGGVSASFAMLGDIIIAEKGSMIGFAGKRVIEETIKEQLPEDFQTAEYLLEHGMIDMVVHRKELNQSLSKVLSFVKK